MQLDAAKGEALKRAGQQIALDFAGDWAERVVAEFTAWVAAQRAQGFKTVTIEAFRAQARNNPPTSKAWGSLPRLAVKRGLIAPTERYTKAAAPRTRSHPVRVWSIE